jgi:hypothetical protein
MKISKLKSISISICCLVSSLWSETQCMDTTSYRQEETSYKYNYNENYLDNLNQEKNIYDIFSNKETESSNNYYFDEIKKLINHGMIYIIEHPYQSVLIGIAWQSLGIEANENKDDKEQSTGFYMAATIAGGTTMLISGCKIFEWISKSMKTPRKNSSWFKPSEWEYTWWYSTRQKWWDGVEQASRSIKDFTTPINDMAKAAKDLLK